MSIKRLIETIKAKLINYKNVKVLIGKNKRPIDSDGEIIFHIDI